MLQESFSLSATWPHVPETPNWVTLQELQTYAYRLQDIVAKPRRPAPKGPSTQIQSMYPKLQLGFLIQKPWIFHIWVPQTIIRIPNIETIDTPYLGTWTLRVLSFPKRQGSLSLIFLVFGQALLVLLGILGTLTATHDPWQRSTELSYPEGPDI